MFTGTTPLFQQLATRLADDIVSETYPEESAVPSATDLAVFFDLNPATASKGVNLLVEQGALYKKRGIGIFVAPGARELLLAQRRERLRADFVEPLVREANLLGLDPAEIERLIRDTIAKEPS
ncbi:GntR family transcriptional regulator [Mycetocola lacteus]|uniref:GntR family transcriptional regulator n=1 Tax=Mycetocola lacteus TaxID=76637 RepID=A0A3L7ASB4_9MICO|nr:GntR family transcriptional regulator [Mycetocola lacteus]RLP82292.1 GntR family transcriptional regulator [Mycetocola lacteus]